MQLPELGTFNTAFLVTSLTAVLANHILNWLKGAPGQLQNWFVNRFSYSVEIPQGKSPFDAVRAFLGSRRYVFRVRAFSVHWGPAAGGQGSEWHFPPAPGRVYFWYKGHLARASRSRRNLEGTAGSSFAFHEDMTVRFFFAGPELVREFIREADAAWDRVDNRLKVYAPAHWSGWDNPVHVNPRDVATVVLPAGVAERVEGEIREFLGAGEWYAERGIPHRRGYLLHGTPGSGKTSFIKSLAARFGKSLGVFSLAKMDDRGLMGLMLTLPRGTWPVFEDVDCLFDGREGGETKLTFSGLLNALDGVASQEGYVLFMTTNHPERLDAALVRPGRVDEMVHLGDATAEQAGRYFRNFYGGGSEALAAQFADAYERRQSPLSMAAIQELLIRNKHTPERVVEAIR